MEHLNLTLAVPLHLIPKSQHRCPPHLAVTLKLVALALALTSEKDPKCNYKPILPLHLLENLTLSLALACGPDPYCHQ